LRLSLANSLLAVLSAVAIITALWRLHANTAGVDISALEVDGAPATIYRPASGALGPVVVIAHGFAGSGRLMQSFALTFARNGYVAATFDFPGHGRNPTPLTGDIAHVEGATRALVAATAKAAAAVRGLGDGRLAVLGHSMASDIVVRFAESDPDVAATIAVSMFSPAVTAAAPKNLLVIVGDWEGFLKSEALRAVGLATAPAAAEPGVTYGEIAAGTGRRVAFSPHVEHASVLFSQASMRESLAWLDQTFGVVRTAPPALDSRGPWILVLIAGVVGLARPLSTLLPVAAVPKIGAGLGWRRLFAPMLTPMIATPLLLRVMPTHFLPVLVADYLAVHFAVYGLITAIALVVIRRRTGMAPRARVSVPALAAAAAAITAYGFLVLVWPIDSFITSFVLGPERFTLVAALLAGTALYFLSDEWLTRGIGEGRGAYPASKLAFLASLAFAIALDFERLFFLILIVPVIALFFVVHGLFSGWAYRRAGHPFAAGIANAIAFAWAIGVTFPLVAG
jgi:dienelactone hydrolase